MQEAYEAAHHLTNILVMVQFTQLDMWNVGITVSDKSCPPFNTWLTAPVLLLNPDISNPDVRSYFLY